MTRILHWRERLRMAQCFIQWELMYVSIQIAEVTDFSKTFWKSSAGSLYSNPVVRSRPGSRNEDEARARSSRYVFCDWLFL